MMEDAYPKTQEEKVYTQEDAQEIWNRAYRDGGKEDAAQAYDVFFRAFYPIVFKHMRANCRTYEDAQEMASSVMLYCYRNFERYDPQRGSMSAWVGIIMNSRLKNYWKRTRLYESLDRLQEEGKAPFPAQGDDIERAMQIGEARRLTAAALECLTDRQRSIVVMRFFRDMQHREIADKLGMSEGAVRVQLFRALRRMQETLNEMSHYEQEEENHEKGHFPQRGAGAA